MEAPIFANKQKGIKKWQRLDINLWPREDQYLCGTCFGIKIIISYTYSLDDLGKYNR